jgi:tetratricopeptide (TPR) repeat protein
LLHQLSQSNTNIATLKIEDEFYQGILHLNIGDYPQAERAFHNSLVYYQQSGEQWQEVNVWLYLAECSIEQGNFVQAEKYSQKALTLAHAVGDRKQILLGLGTLGLIANGQGRNDISRRFCEECLEIAQALDDLGMQGIMLREIGTSLTNEKRADEGVLYQQKGVTILRRLGDRYQLAHAMHQLAMTHMALGDLETAQAWLREGEKIARENQDLRHLSNLLFGHSLVDFFLCQYDHSLLHVLESESLARQTGLVITFSSIGWYCLGWVLLVLEIVLQAEKYFFQALTSETLSALSALLPTAYLLVRRQSNPINIQQAWHLVVLAESSDRASAYPPLMAFAERLRPPQLFTLSTEEIEAAKAYGRTLNPDIIIAELIEELPKLGWGESVVPKNTRDNRSQNLIDRNNDQK